ncbi:MAG: MerR family DNA-binding transcriptional regulator [Pseudomonadota bacterium]
MAAETLTISEMCALFEVTPRTLRFYEDKELISPIRDGQRRLYTKREIGRMRWITHGKRFGFSLEEIRELLDLYYLGDQQETQLRRTYDVGRGHLATLKEKREELKASITDLEELLAQCKQKIDTYPVQAAAE